LLDAEFQNKEREGCEYGRSNKINLVGNQKENLIVLSKASNIIDSHKKRVIIEIRELVLISVTSGG